MTNSSVSGERSTLFNINHDKRDSHLNDSDAHAVAVFRLNKKNALVPEDHYLQRSQYFIKTVEDYAPVYNSFVDAFGSANTAGIRVINYEYQAANDPLSANVQTHIEPQVGEVNPDVIKRLSPVPVVKAAASIYDRDLDALASDSNAIRNFYDGKYKSVANTLDQLVVNGSNWSYQNTPLYGITNAPGRVSVALSANWNVSTSDPYADIVNMIKGLRDNGNWAQASEQTGDFLLYLSTDYYDRLNNYYPGPAGATVVNFQTIKQRIMLAYPNIRFVLSEKIPQHNVYLLPVRGTSCLMLVGLGLTYRRLAGGDGKADTDVFYTIQAPLIFHNYLNQCGIAEGKGTAT